MVVVINSVNGFRIINKLLGWGGHGQMGCTYQRYIKGESKDVQGQTLSSFIGYVFKGFLWRRRRRLTQEGC